MARQMGRLSRYEGDGENPEYCKGRLAASFYSGDLFMVPNAEKRSENSPDWTVKRPNPMGSGWVEFGNAWTKRQRDGTEFLSITFDDEMMAKPIYCAAFMADQQPDDGSTLYQIVWSRPRRQAGAMAAPSPELNDEIPY